MTKRMIKNASYEGERPLFASRHLRLEDVIIYPGESALKECSDIEAVRCEFRGKYPFWHNETGCWWNIACSGKAPGPPSGIPGICT